VSLTGRLVTATRQARLRTGRHCSKVRRWKETTIAATYIPAQENPQQNQNVELAVTMTEHVAMFGEWRLSQDRVAFRNAGFLDAGDQERLDMTQTVQLYVFGLSYRL